MARFDALRGNAGAKAAEARGKAKRTRFTPQIQWEEGERKYIQFVTPWDERISAPMHQFIRTSRSDKTKSGYTYSDFLIAPQEDGSAGVDLIYQKFGVEPTDRTIMVAVELEPIKERKGDSKRMKIVGFKPKMREWEDKDGEEHESPEMGLIIQSQFNFWGMFEKYEDEDAPVDETVFEVTRLGSGTNTSYNVNGVGDVIELDFDEDNDFVDIDQWLEEVADPDRMEALIGPLPDDWQVSQYANRGKDDKKSSAKKKSSRLGKKKAEAPVEDDGDDEGEGSGEDTSEGSEPVSRKAKFANLRKDLAAKS